MTLAQAKTLKAGDFIHHKTKTDTTGNMRAKVTSVKTWKTRPNEICIRFKRGLYEYGSIREHELKDYGLGYAPAKRRT